jgi:uncharacterized protein (TIGR02246 family)
MRASTVVLGLGTLAVACAAWTVWAADAEEDAAAIRKKIEAYVEAYNRHDAAAVAALWSEAGVYVHRDTGERIQGRTAIAAMFRELFQAGDAAHLSVTIDSIRLINSDVAIEDGNAELVSPDGEQTASTYTAVHVKRDGGWYLDSVRETDTPSPPPAEPSHLDQLSWMVGEWLDHDENATVRTKCEWAKNRHFLVSSFTVGIGDDVDLEGTQIIGWDPVAGQIRSWMFDSEGGFGEGAWRRAGNQWTVDSSATLSDGSQASAVNVYTLVDENTFAWKSVDRQLDGEPQPDIDEVQVSRQ